MASSIAKGQLVDDSSDQNVHDLFVEILLEKEIELPDRIEAFVSQIEPRHCRSVLKDLAAKLPLQNFSTDGHQNANIGQKDFTPMGHLKRVRRRQATISTDIIMPDDTDTNQSNTNTHTHSCSSSNETSSPPPPKKRTHNEKTQGSPQLHLLEIVLSSVHDFKETEWMSQVIQKYNLHLERRWLPGRPAESKLELDEWNCIWPTIYFHKKSKEHKKQELDLTRVELLGMKHGMEEAIRDGQKAPQSEAATTTRFHNHYFSSSKLPLGGAVVMHPETQSIIATASEERQTQRNNSPGSETSFLGQRNPLCTAAMLAIQAVSRLERKVAMGHGMDSEHFKSGQYLCTG